MHAAVQPLVPRRLLAGPWKVPRRCTQPCSRAYPIESGSRLRRPSYTGTSSQSTPARAVCGAATRTRSEGLYPSMLTDRLTAVAGAKVCTSLRPPEGSSPRKMPPWPRSSKPSRPDSRFPNSQSVTPNQPLVLEPRRPDSGAAQLQRRAHVHLARALPAAVVDEHAVPRGA